MEQKQMVSKAIFEGRRRKRTLNIGNALLQDLLENLGVLQLIGDLLDDGLGELLLLSLLNLGLVSDPAVENLLGLVDKVGSLLQLESLGLESGSFL